MGPYPPTLFESGGRTVKNAIRPQHAPFPGTACGEGPDLPKRLP